MKIRSTIRSRPKLCCVSCAVGLLSLGYCLQLLSPLRLNTDVVRILVLAHSRLGTAGFPGPEHTDQYPPGLPFLLSALWSSGLTGAHWMLLLNLASLAVSCAVWWLIAGDSLSRTSKLIGLLVFLASWCTVKHSTLLLTDLPALALVSLALFLLMKLHRPGTSNQPVIAVVACCACILAIAVRTSSIALIPALVAVGLFRPQLWAAVRSHPRAVFLGLLCILALGAFGIWMAHPWAHRQFAAPGSYGQSLVLFAAQEDRLSRLLGILGYRGKELISLVTNTPMVAMPPALAALIGALGFSALCIAAWKTRDTLLPISVFVVSQLMILVVWPFEDPRFLMGIMPFAVLLLLTTGWFERPRYANLGRAWLGGYVLLGCTSMIYSSWLSLSGHHFGDRFGNGSKRESYAAAWNTNTVTHSQAVNPHEVLLLRIHNPAPFETLVRWKERPQLPPTIHR